MQNGQKEKMYKENNTEQFCKLILTWANNFWGMSGEKNVGSWNEVDGTKLSFLTLTVTQIVA